MKSDIEVYNYLCEFRKEFDGYKDTGFEFVRRLIQFAKTLSGVDRDRLRNEFLRMVEEELQYWYHTALECLEKVWGLEVALELVSFLDKGGHSEDWAYDVLLALVSMKYQPIADRAVLHVSTLAANGSDRLYPLLQALCGVDEQACYRLLASDVIEKYVSGNNKEAKRGMTIAYWRLSETAFNKLWSFVEVVKKSDHGVALFVADVFVEELKDDLRLKIIDADEFSFLKDKIMAAVS